ncbi:GNA1162 family protein [Thiovibrio sp. JS02]
MRFVKLIVLSVVCALVSACATAPLTFHDQNMDFSTIQTVAVLPFANLTGQKNVEDRVRDVFMNMLLSTGGVYVLPAGEVARGISRSQIAEGTAPSVEEIQKLGEVLGADAVITGVLKEYGEVRSGTAAANVISLSLQLVEVQTGRVVWVGASTKGGISVKDRLLGGGGQPMNKITEEAVSELIQMLFLG